MLKKLLIIGILISILLLATGCTGSNSGDPSALPEEPEDEVTLTASPTSTTSPTENAGTHRHGHSAADRDEYANGKAVLRGGGRDR